MRRGQAVLGRVRRRLGIRREWGVGRVGVGLGLVAVFGVLGLIGASPAQAHSTLIGSTPAAGAELDVAPTVVTLRFDEPVGINAGSLMVLDRTGRRVDSRHPQQPATDPSVVQVGLPPGLPRGSYGVVWRVVSADGHPVDGTLSFGIGVPAGALPAQTTPDPATAVLHEVVLLTAYLGAMALIGVAFFTLVVWPAGLHERRPRQLLVGGWWLSVGSAAVLFVVQGPLGAGLGPVSALDPGLLAQTFTSRFGILLVLRVFALGLAAVAGPWPGSAPVAAVRRDALGLALLLLPTFSLAGHSGEGSLAALSVITDALHLAAASVWLGGLTVLLTCVRRPDAGVARRWTATATTAVAVLAGTGAFQSWRAVATVPVSELTTTQYGRLLVLKVALVVVLVLLGDQGRRRLQRGSLRRTVTCELAVGVAVLAVTSALVGTQPARQAYAAPFSATVIARDTDGAQITVQVNVAPTRAGYQTLRLSAPHVVSARGSLVHRAPDSSTAPVRFDFTGVGAGTSTAQNVIVPVPGRWTLTVQVQTDPWTDYSGSVTYDVL